MTERVIFGIPQLSESDAVMRVLDLTRSLNESGFETSVLITEPAVGQTTPQVPGISVAQIAHAPHDRPSDAWLSLVRHLEECAPCVYVSNQDYRASLALCRLSNRVRVIGFLHENSQEEYDHLARLGEFWNAIIVQDPALRQRIIGEYPAFAARLARSSGNASDFADLIREVNAAVGSGKYRRRQKKLIAPPPHLVPGLSNRETGVEVSRFNAVPLWPDLPQTQPRSVHGSRAAHSLEEQRIVLAVPTGRVSGVDVFSINLARELLRRGYKAELVQTMPDAAVSDRIPLPADVPVGHLNLRQFPTWRERWAAMREYLEQRAPCIYIPNYDDKHSCIIPTLSPGVKVVGIGHSDDAQHYAHILSLAPYWDAIVGVSSAITESIRSLAPGIESRQYTIPYGVPVPRELPARNTSSPTRAVYAGRIVRFQKRALDLVSIAEELKARGAQVELTVAGTGTELSEFLAAAGPAMLSRHLRYVGGLTNEQVHEVIAESGVFVLPSSFEGLPVSLLEAMANGCVPVVSAIRSGVPEVIVDGENGFTVPIGDIEAFVNRIMMLAADRDLLSRLRASAHATARDRFSVERMTSSYLEVFESIIARPYERPKGSVKPPPSLNPIEAFMPRFPMPVRRLVWRVRGRK